MIKKRKKLIIIFLTAAAIMLVAYFAVLSPILRRMNATEEENPEVLAGEVYDSSGSVMMFEKIEEANLYRIEIHNSYGEWAVYRASDDNFYIEGHESVPYNTTNFSSLVVSAGYTLSLQRVSTDPARYPEFGLDAESSPAYYTITSKDGAEYTVYIGDKIPTAGGYYARLEGRDAVYILARDVGGTLLAPVNSIAHSMVSYPISSTKSFQTRNFYIVKDGEFAVWIDTENASSADSAELAKYVMRSPVGFSPNTDNYGTILSNFTEFSGEGVVAIGPELEDLLAQAGTGNERINELVKQTERYNSTTKNEISEEYQLLCIDQVKALMRASFDRKTLDRYGLYEPSRILHYQYNSVDSFVLFGETQEDGYRYAYSALWNTIVAFKPEKLEFLDWDLIKLVDPSIFSVNIADVARMTFTSDEISETFNFAGGSDTLTVTPESTGKAFDSAELYNFRNFYRSLLIISLQGYADSTETENKILSFTIDKANGENLVFDFYRYSTRRCFYTVNGIGQFYVLSDSVTKVIDDCVKVMNSQDVDSWAKN